MTAPTLRRLMPAVLFLTALAARAQTPSPTPTPTPTPTPSETPTPAPTPTPVSISATTLLYTAPNSETYDAANIVIDSDGSIWTASGLTDEITHLASDGSTIRNWPMPANAAPSSLLRDDDGSFWFTEIGGWNVGHLDPVTNTLTEWPDLENRPTALIRRPDGKFWLPETAGVLALFDTVQNQVTYYYPDSTNTYTLSYPWVDPDGSLFACDFALYGIVKFSPDGTSYTRWDLPTDLYYDPSKIVRMPDGGLWISFWGSSQLGRFDDTTNELTLYDLPIGALPYDLKPYRGRILYSGQTGGIIGLLDPSVAIPSTILTLTPYTTATTTTTYPSIPVTQTLVPADATPSATNYQSIVGTSGQGLTQLPVGNGNPVWGFAIDEARARIWFNTIGAMGMLLPPAPVNTGDIFVPLARSSSGPGSNAYQTQTFVWNRGTPDATNATYAITANEILLPSGWIAGLQPFTSLTIPPTQLAVQADPIGVDMGAPGSRGALWFSAASGSSDLFVVTRTATARGDGGTYGSALNGFTAPDAVGPGDTAFVFTPPGDAANLVYAGLVVLYSSTGTISILGADGTVYGSYQYDWPRGYQVDGTTIWDAFGIPPVPGGRIVFAPDTGNIFPYGVAFDPTTGDPIALDVMKPAGAAIAQTLPFVTRGGGPLGPTSQTSLQVANPGTTDASVSFFFRPSSTSGAPTPEPVSLPTATVPAGHVVSLPDILANVGPGPLVGALDLFSDQPLHAFARVLGSLNGGGSWGLGSSQAPAIPGGFKAVFLGLADNAAFESDLVLINQGAASASVTVNLFAADGSAAGSAVLVLAPREVRFIPSVWPTLAGASTDLGRLEVVPADGAGPVSTTLVRTDRRTLDADALVPFQIPQ